MKKTLFLLLISLSLYSQKNFKWDITDSVNKTKSQIYFDTKLFISDTWKSTKAVIQSDDKESGMILLTGVLKQSINRSMGIATFYYSYNIKFLQKENRYKVIIDNVNFKSGPGLDESWNAYDLNAKDVYPGKNICGLKEKEFQQLMESLRADIQMIVISYLTKIKEPTKSDW